ncbi:hypothetical protein ALC56_15202, partial [Trachymyrmex septentrionalis]
AIGSLLFAHPPTNINDHLPSLKALIRRDAATGSEATICPRNGNRNPAGPGNEIRVVPSTHRGLRGLTVAGVSLLLRIFSRICFMHYAAPRAYATLVSQSEVQTSSAFVPEVITQQQQQQRQQSNLFSSVARSFRRGAARRGATSRASAGHRFHRSRFCNGASCQVESKIPLWLTSGCRLGIQEGEQKRDDDEERKKRTMKRKKTRERLATKATPTNLACGEPCGHRFSLRKRIAKDGKAAE